MGKPGAPNDCFLQNICSERNKIKNREIKIDVYAKQQTWICTTRDQVFPLIVVNCFLFLIKNK